MYPKTKYHVRGGGSITVVTESQEKALGDEWQDFRSHPETPKEKEKPVPVEVKQPEPEPVKTKGRPP